MLERIVHVNCTNEWLERAAGYGIRGVHLDTIERLFEGNRDLNSRTDANNWRGGPPPRGSIDSPWRRVGRVITLMEVKGVPKKGQLGVPAHKQETSAVESSIIIFELRGTKRGWAYYEGLEFLAPVRNTEEEIVKFLNIGKVLS